MSGDQRIKWSGQAEDLPGEIEMQGFEEAYAKYVEYLKSHRKPFRLLFFVGWPIFVVGYLSIFFGSSTKVVNAFSEYSLFKLIQLHALGITCTGLFVLGIATWWFLSQIIVLSPAEYFCEYVDWDPIDETNPMRAWCIDYLGGNSFYVYWDTEPETVSEE